MERVKVGIIGCGIAGNFHLRELTKLKNAEVKAFYDVDPTKAKMMAAKVGGNVYSTLSEFLNQKLDAIYICTPPNTHSKLIEKVAQKDVAIFVEKPLDTDVKRAEKAVKLVERKGIINQIGFNFRFAPNVSRLKELVRRKDLKFKFFHAMWLGTKPQEPAWWGRYEITGGMINELNSHLLDLIRFVAGEIEEVLCKRERLFYDASHYTNEDTIVGFLKLKDDISGCIVSTSGAHFTRTLGFAEFIPFWHTQYINCIFLAKDATFELFGASKLIYNDGNKRIEYEDFKNMYLEENTAFLRSILKNKESPVPLREGLRTLRVVEAARKSSRLLKFVKVGDLD